MLQFARAQSRFLLYGTPIGPGVRTSQLSASLALEVQEIPDTAFFSFLQVNARPISAFITLAEGQVHSGYFWAYVPSGGWEQHECTERNRRAEHERLMEELFGAVRFEDKAIAVDLIRDPRFGLEQIAFQIKQAACPR